LVSIIADASSPPSNVWSALPALLWFLLAALALFTLRREISTLFENLSWRLRTGAEVKLFSLELGQSYVAQSIDGAADEMHFEHYPDKDGARWKERERYYLPSRHVLLVHRIAPSKHPGMLYDVQIYLLPHRGRGTLANVSKVDYYFGKHWGNQIFICTDRGRGFPITTSAYGPFMCTAELTFTDGEKVMIGRYIDFEMGAVGRDSGEAG
jgi:hypothetical protein